MNEKKVMTLEEAFSCPNCGAAEVSLTHIQQIFSDARSEDVTCMKCNTSWRVYYKMFDFNKQLIQSSTECTEPPISHIVDAELVEALQSEELQKSQKGI